MSPTQAGVTIGESTMRMFDAEPTLVQDLKEEGHIATVKETASFTVTAVRHPTLGRLVIVEPPNGPGVVVETED